MRKGPAVFCISVGCCALSGSTPARADASAEIYSDLRDVVEELITVEFAESSTVWLACNSKRLPRYDVRSLQRLAQRQWGQLKPALRDDAIDVTADYIYEVSRDIAGKGLTESKMNKTRDATKPEFTLSASRSIEDILTGWPDWRFDDMGKEPGPNTLESACAKAMDLGHEDREKYRRMIVAAVLRRKPEPALVDTCAQEASSPQDTIACSFARSVKGALQGKRAYAQAALLEFVTEALFLTGEFPKGEADAAKLSALKSRVLTQLVAWVKNDKQKSVSTIDQTIRPILDVLRGVKPEDLSGCKGQSLASVIKAVAADPAKPDTVRSRGCMLVGDVRGELAKLKFAATIDGDAFALSLPDALDALPKPGSAAGSLTTPEVIASLILCRAKNDKDSFSPLCADGQIVRPEKNAPPRKLRIALADLAWDVSIDSTGLKVATGSGTVPLTAACNAGLDIRAAFDVLTDGVTSLLDDKSANPLTWTPPIARLALQLRLLLDDLERLRLFSEDDKPDYAGLVEAALTAIRKSPRLCAPPANPPIGTDKIDEVCVPLRAIGEFLSKHGSDINAMIAAAGRRDYRTLSLSFLESVLPQDESSEGKCDLSKPPYRHLALTFASYLLDEASDAPDRNVGREAFRAAAIEALRCTSTGGLDRRYNRLFRSDYYPGDGVAHLFYRSAAIRPSWNASYRNETGTNGYRTVVSLNAFTTHFRMTPRRSSVYAGLDISLVDYVAPLAELAFRRATDTTYVDQNMLFLDLIRPRIDFMLGLPVLSDHLGVSLGGSWRTVVPIPGPATSPNTLTYKAWWANDDRVKGNYAAFFEFGFGAHYVF